uniref:MAC/Perforin domain containing protein, putative n=1 Tax=Theileria annulata TaxID=5874 RepID=A0A3B0MEI3_THEAN
MKIRIAFNILVIKILLSVCKALLWESRRKDKESPKVGIKSNSGKELNELLNEKRKQKSYNKKFSPNNKQGGRRASGSFLERGSRSKNEKELTQIRQKLAKDRFQQKQAIYSDGKSAHIQNNFSNNTKDYNTDGLILDHRFHHEKHEDDMGPYYHDTEDLDDYEEEDENEHDGVELDDGYYDGYFLDDDEDFEEELRRRKIHRNKPNRTSYIQLNSRDQSNETIPKYRKGNKSSGLLNTIMNTPIRQTNPLIHPSDGLEHDSSNSKEHENGEDLEENTYDDLNLFPLLDDEKDKTAGHSEDKIDNSLSEKLEKPKKPKQHNPNKLPENSLEDGDNYSTLEPNPINNKLNHKESNKVEPSPVVKEDEEVDKSDPASMDDKPFFQKNFKDKWTKNMDSIDLNIEPDHMKSMKQLGGDFGDEFPEIEGHIKRHSERTHEVESGSTRRVTNSEDFRDPSLDWNNSGLAASMRYLGSGYDIIFGNPLGDPVVMMDQGYRNPVLKLNWEDEYLNKDGANLKEPRGSWIRPEYSCRQSETIDHVNTVDDFKKELSVDAQASYGIPYFFSFSASTGYKNFVKSTASNKVRTYITKTYCLRYVGGIVDYHSLETTEEFKKAVAALPDRFDSHRCTLDMFKSNEDDPMCAENVWPWMQFIKMFGTHFTTIVHLGGKITHQVQIDKSDVLHMQQSGVNVDLAVKATISPSFVDSLEVGTTTNTEKGSVSLSNNLKYEKQVLVIGGDGLVDSKDVNSLNNWARELYKRPMPIKIKLESIKTLLGDKKDLFDEALRFYSETYGVSPDEIYKKYGKEFGIASAIEKGHQIVYSGNKSGSAVCPNKTVIIMGFSLSIVKKKNLVGKNVFSLHITQCPVGEEKCIVSSDNPMSESRIWAICGEDTIPLLNQQTSSKLDEPAVASCPAGYSIAYGFALSVPKGNVTLSTDSYACRPGTQSCTHESTDKSATNAVWIACVENGAPQLTEISNHVVSTSSRYCSNKTKDNKYDDNSCPINSKLIAGWSMEFSETDNNSNKIEKCSKGTFGCKVDQLMKTENKCRSHYSWISCLHEEGAGSTENTEST